ncbi:MAG: molecular chaperone TorD family protein [Burkholderiales bacterium]|nr:molecular chaperone TorD family protein [Burkholderiales bacterium]
MTLSSRLSQVAPSAAVKELPYDALADFTPITECARTCGLATRDSDVSPAMAMNAPVQVEDLQGEMLLCGLLGKALYAYPERAWLDQLIEQDVFVQAPVGTAQPDITAGLELLQEWSASNRGGLTDPDFEAIVSDHMQLFVGPGKLLAAPWASVYADRDRMVFQSVTNQVRDWYARYGLARAGNYREPEDHVGMEFGFLAHLTGLAIEALESGEARNIGVFLAARREFLSEHMTRWVPRWCREMESHARTQYYRGLARMSRGALQVLDPPGQAAGSR